MTFSGMITTKNRSADLRRTLAVLRTLNPTPLELLITADGCTDGTVEILKAEKLRSENPKVIGNDVGRGSVASRDRMMREARGDLMLALDDDSYPEQPDCLDILSSILHLRPSLAIATFPQRTDEYPETLTKADFGAERVIRSFPNSGASLRVSTYRSLAGFEPMFFHKYEEPPMKGFRSWHKTPARRFPWTRKAWTGYKKAIKDRLFFAGYSKGWLKDVKDLTKAKTKKRNGESIGQ